MPTPGPFRPSPAMSRLRRLLTGSLLAMGLLLGGVVLWAILGTPAPDWGRLWIALAVDSALFTVLMLGLQWAVWHRLVAFWQRRATMDDLTGLLRPGAFWAGTEEAAQIRGQRPWVIVYADLDDFKQVNEGYSPPISFHSRLVGFPQQNNVGGTAED